MPLGRDELVRVRFLFGADSPRGERVTAARNLALALLLVLLGNAAVIALRLAALRGGAW